MIAAAWDADAVLLLIRAGGNVNAQSKKGFTPLINCAEPEVARVLLAHGADPSVRDAEGKAALEVARKNGMKEKEAVLSAKTH